MILNCIAVDDEPLALGLLCSFIEQTPFLKLKGKFFSGIKALETLHDEQIDLIFLDIHMSDLSGIQLARSLEDQDGKRKPRIIFTTAFNNYAIEGYKVDALDYLLKPFNYEEFLRASNKALAYFNLIRARPMEDQVSEDFLFLKVEYHLVKIAFDDILFIEGLKDYAKIHLSNNAKPILSLITLKSLEEKLPAKRFMRIHRSFIVSLDKITSITKNSVQVSETSITVGEQYKEEFNLYLSKWLNSK